MTDEHLGSAEERPERRSVAPEALRLRTVMPSLTVDDLESSLRFYADGLGFTVQERWEEDGKLLGAMLVAGACHLGLSQDDWSQGRDRTKGVGFRIWAETAQDLDRLAERMREQSIEHVGPKEESWGSRSLSVVDPDGYKLSFTTPRED